MQNRNEDQLKLSDATNKQQPQFDSNHQSQTDEQNNKLINSCWKFQVTRSYDSQQLKSTCNLQVGTNLTMHFDQENQGPLNQQKISLPHSGPKTDTSTLSSSLLKIPSQNAVPELLNPLMQIRNFNPARKLSQAHPQNKSKPFTQKLQQSQIRFPSAKASQDVEMTCEEEIKGQIERNQILNQRQSSKEEMPPRRSGTRAKVISRRNESQSLTRAIVSKFNKEGSKPESTLWSLKTEDELMNLVYKAYQESESNLRKRYNLKDVVVYSYHQEQQSIKCEDINSAQQMSKLVGKRVNVNPNNSKRKVNDGRNYLSKLVTQCEGKMSLGFNPDPYSEMLVIINEANLASIINYYTFWCSELLLFLIREFQKNGGFFKILFHDSTQAVSQATAKPKTKREMKLLQQSNPTGGNQALKNSNQKSTKSDHYEFSPQDFEVFVSDIVAQKVPINLIIPESLKLSEKDSRNFKLFRQILNYKHSLEAKNDGRSLFIMTEESALAQLQRLQVFSVDFHMNLGLDRFLHGYPIWPNYGFFFIPLRPYDPTDSNTMHNVYEKVGSKWTYKAEQWMDIWNLYKNTKDSYKRPSNFLYSYRGDAPIGQNVIFLEYDFINLTRLQINEGKLAYHKRTSVDYHRKQKQHAKKQPIESIQIRKNPDGHFLCLMCSRTSNEDVEEHIKGKEHQRRLEKDKAIFDEIDELCGELHEKMDERISRAWNMEGCYAIQNEECTSLVEMSGIYKEDSKSVNSSRRFKGANNGYQLLKTNVSLRQKVIEFEDENENEKETETEQDQDIRYENEDKVINLLSQATPLQGFSQSFMSRNASALTVGSTPMFKQVSEFVRKGPKQRLIGNESVHAARTQNQQDLNKGKKKAIFTQLSQATSVEGPAFTSGRQGDQNNGLGFFQNQHEERPKFKNSTKVPLGFIHGRTKRDFEEEKEYDFLMNQNDAQSLAKRRYYVPKAKKISDQSESLPGQSFNTTQDQSNIVAHDEGEPMQ